MAADVGGPEFDAHTADALWLLLALVDKGRGVYSSSGDKDGEEEGEEEDDDGWSEGAATDNAISAAFRVLFGRPGPACAAFAGSGGGGGGAPAVAAVVKSLLDALPITVDVAEGQSCHRRVVDLAIRRHEFFFGSGGIGGSSSSSDHARVIVPKLVAALAGALQYQPSPLELDQARGEVCGASCGGAGCGAGAALACNRGGSGGTQEELWSRQLVDEATRRRAEEALAGIKGEFPQAFEEAWAGLGERRRRALQMTTAEVCARGSGAAAP